MFDVGFTEIVLIAVIGLIVIGPERLPKAARTAGMWIGKIKRSVTTIQADVQRELAADEIRQSLKDNGKLGNDVSEFGRALTQDILAPDSPSGASPAAKTPEPFDPAAFTGEDLAAVPSPMNPAKDSPDVAEPAPSDEAAGHTASHTARPNNEDTRP